MFDLTVVCVFIVNLFLVAGLIMSVCTSISWPSSELIKLNATGGPLEGLLTSTETSWIGSLTSVGCIFGPFFGGFLANSLGRKMTFLTITVPVIIGYTICAFARHLYLFYIARFIIGVALSALQLTNAIYVGEIARDEHRGMLSAVLLIALNLGVLLSYCVGPYTSVRFFNLLLAVLATIFFVLFCIVGKETPYYFLLKNQNDKAKENLHTLKKQSYESLEQELEEIKRNIKIAKKESQKASIKDFFKTTASRRSLTIALGLFTFQQLSGSLAVLSYTQQIFEDAGSSLPPEISSIILGVLQLVACLYFPYILKHIGRKTIILYSAIVMAIAEITLGVYFILKETRDLKSYGVLPIVCLCLYTVAINNGVGNIPVVFLSEIFPDNIKAPAASISIVWCWCLAFFVAKFFQPLSDIIGIGQCFIGFGLICVLCVVFIHFFVIETKGKSLREIQDELNK